MAELVYPVDKILELVGDDCHEKPSKKNQNKTGIQQAICQDDEVIELIHQEGGYQATKENISLL